MNKALTGAILGVLVATVARADDSPPKIYGFGLYATRQETQAQCMKLTGVWLRVSPRVLRKAKLHTAGDVFSCEPAQLHGRIDPQIVLFTFLDDRMVTLDVQWDDASNYRLWQSIYSQVCELTLVDENSTICDGPGWDLMVRMGKRGAEVLFSRHDVGREKL